MKKLLLGILVLLAVLAATFGALSFVWSQYEPPEIVGQTVQSDSKDLEMLTLEWFKSYTDQLKSWTVPPKYHLLSANIDSSELLEDGFVQLDYTLHTLCRKPEFPADFDHYQLETSRLYEGQMVFQWQKIDGEWVILDVMRPAEYQIRFSPEIQAERELPEVAHYKLQTYDDAPYAVRDGKLYVTYDAGTTYLEVPEGYELVCKDLNGGYTELLPMNSYVITPGFTAFLTYESTGSYSATYLLYSTDEGQTWEKSLIFPGGYKANSFLSQTETGCYATFATDRAAGSDYYVTYYSEDLETWTEVPRPSHNRNYTCVYWPETGVGYYSGETITFLSTGEDGSTTEEVQSNVFYRTEDGGESYDTLYYPEAWEVTQELGFFPFDTLDAMYQDGGKLYMVVGQGDDGDYTQDGQPVKALYESEDRENFTFLETFTEDIVPAG